jgi:hypothetical protein
MRERIWAALAVRHGITRERARTWTVERPGLQALMRSGAFNAVAGSTVRAALDDLLGPGQWSPPAVWGRPLVTFPATAAAWDVPAPAGDATRPADVKASLAARHPWLRELWTTGDASDRVPRFLGRGKVIDGVPVRMAELTGAPGDVVLMDSQVLHAATINCRTEPRMMLLTIIGRKP